MSLPLIHDRLANTVVLYCLALSLWAFWRFFRKQGVDSSFWGALVIGEILILLQGALGGIMWLFNALRPERGGIHLLYGIISAMTIPAVYAFTRGRADRRDMFVYAASLLFLFGIALRAMTTGG
jgi:heme A synthase